MPKEIFDNELNEHLQEPENTCSFCGVECEDYFCSDDCKIAELNDQDHGTRIDRIRKRND